jgi:Ca2+/Na+ antiporter
VKEFNNKVYRLLTYGIKDILLFFLRGFIVLSIYFFWVIFRADLRGGIVCAAVFVLLILIVVYLYRKRIVYVPPKPREKPEPKKEEAPKEEEAEKKKEEFVMNVDESAFSNFTFNDYVTDTFKKQDSNQILDLLADKNKLILEELHNS